MNSDEQSIPVITIDGPSGAGKGSVAQSLARQLGFHLLDSGAIYRAAAVCGRDVPVDPPVFNPDERRAPGPPRPEPHPVFSIVRDRGGHHLLRRRAVLLRRREPDRPAGR